MSNWTARDALAHHGILGMKWGKKNGPPYPLDPSDHSAAEKKAGYQKSISGGGSDTGTKKKRRKWSELSNEEKKKYIKIGAAVVGTVLVAYGGYRLANSSYAKSMAQSVLDKISKRPSIEEALANNGPEIVRKMPKDLGGVTNPKGLKDNCKDVAEATLKRWLGVDPGAVAGQKTVTGNLHDFVEQRGYNKVGVKWLGENGAIDPDPSGNSADRVTRQILKNFNDGDCGMIGVEWKKNILKPGMPPGHAFNWFISNGKVHFVDDQPDPPIMDAIGHFAKINSSIEIEVLKLTKEAFT